MVYRCNVYIQCSLEFVYRNTTTVVWVLITTMTVTQKVVLYKCPLQNKELRLASLVARINSSLGLSLIGCVILRTRVV